MHRGSSGILPMQELRALVSAGAIRGVPAIDPRQIQPNSLDLRVGPVAFRARYSFLPVHAPVATLLEELTLDRLDLTGGDGALLETGKVYVIPLCEALALPEGLSASANPKSSTGRLDILARLLVDRGSMFDAVPAGYAGPLYLELVPRAFPVRLRAGDSLSQLRLGRGPVRPLPDDELRAEITAGGLVLDEAGRPLAADELAIDDGVFLTVAVTGAPDDEIIGYRAKRSTPAVDFRRLDHPHGLYWEPVRAHDRASERLVLQPEEFYICSSHQRVIIPPHLCAEMVPYDAKSGELRTHYAGFFDSGFGLGCGGARVVLEVRNLDVPFLLQDGQRLFRLRYFRNSAVPEALYGRELGSNYQGQRLRLSKHFSAS
ncbi:MAG: 2'-deoxycytidine 5'-triphosphate deaminase [Deltaproteobacteria bacterium]|nr:2'-deoxycytidine 5'-triphosphate deaminase [Deltaproteobacteria bacterium]